MGSSKSIVESLSSFAPISLADMEGVKLMNRIDTKFAVPLAVLPAILRAARADYFVQENDGLRLAHYDTCYYDTPSLDMYMRHHDRQLVRQKVRVRQYVDSRLTFLEIKRKSNRGRTKKKRILVPGFALRPETLGHGKREDIKVADFIESKSRYSWAELSPRLRTTFSRITLVNRAKTERLTIDLDLRWTNLLTSVECGYPDLVVIELKRDGNCPSPMLRILRDMRIPPFKISKYCIGTALTNPTLKQNRFKKKIRSIEKMLQS